MSESEYPLAPPWIEEMLAENPLITASRRERERQQIENLIQRVERELSVDSTEMAKEKK